MITRLRIRNFRVFSQFEIRARSGLNILVGENESGKSTILQALTLALTGRWHGLWATDSLTADWFHRPTVEAFFDSRADGGSPELPEIGIEIYLDDPGNTLQLLRGVHNSLSKDSVGLRLSIAPSEEYCGEITEYLSSDECPRALPVEYYQVHWRSFADEPLTRRPRGLRHVLIDSRTIRSQRGVDFHTKQLLHDFIEAGERAAISVEQRKARHKISTEFLGSANERIAEREPLVEGREIRLDFDQDTSDSWHAAIVPRIDEIPLALAGQGVQAAMKIALAMSRTADDTSFVLIEEPENHLSHTRLMRLVASIDRLAGERQSFITTHSSYVLNRLGLDHLLLLGQSARRFEDLPADSVEYFKKLSGFDTLRLVLADKLVLVEGPSDEMVLERFYSDRHGVRPADRGVDIVSLRGIALRRSLELCHALGRQVVALRDNDGKEPDHWIAPLEDLLEEGLRELVIGNRDDGESLEPQLLAANDEPTLRGVLGLGEDTNPLDWMTNHKTEAALRILESPSSLTPPPYMARALELLGE
jgi:hypothetical protein